jgi:hypothetical protein
MSGPRLAAVLGRLAGVKREREGFVALCPAHEDREPSLAVAEGEGGRVLLTCRAGCPTPAVLERLGLGWADLMPEREAEWRPPRPAPTSVGWDSWQACAAEAYGALGPWTHAHEYRDADGEPWAVVLRWKRPDGTKAIRPLGLHPDGAWRPSLPESRKRDRSRTLYLRGEAASGEPVFVVEGEAKAELLQQMGLAGASAMGGAKAGALSDWAPLAGRAVVVLPDADAAGLRYAGEVLEALRALRPPAQVEVLSLPGLAADSGEDLAEWVRDRHGEDLHAAAEELRRLAAEALEPKPPEGCVSLADLLADPAILEPPDTFPSGCGWFDSAQPWGAVAEGRIVVFGGDMGSGKSRLLLALARGWAAHRCRVAYLLGEMDRESLVRRSIAAEAGVGMAAFRNPTPEQRRLLESARVRLAEPLRNLHAVEGGLSFGLLEACAAWADVVVLDPLQAVRGAAAYGNRTEELEDLMRLLVRLTQRYGTVFVASSEIGKPPIAGSRDLFTAFKGAAAIPQYAHACYFAEMPEGQTGEQWQTVRCLKQRDGERLDLSVVVTRDRAGVRTEGGARGGR